jgi:NADH dehydrogenase
MEVERSMARGVATVFGGSGFIGRYVVKRLVRRGYLVRVAVRDPEAALFLKPMGTIGQVVPIHANITDDASTAAAMAGADVVINLVGLLSESGGAGFQSVQSEGAARIGRLAAAAGVTRLIHVSAIGADPASPSRYAASKGQGEAAIRSAVPTATILRPSVVFGPEDHFFNKFAGLARVAPVVPVIAGAARLQPVYVGDVADAIMAALDRPDAQGATYELGGPAVWSMRDILVYILRQIGREKPMLAIPGPIARLHAAILELVPGKPLTRDQLLMLQRDNVVSAAAKGLTDLGVMPTPIEMIVPTYLRRFQPGGGRRPAVAGQGG